MQNLAKILDNVKIPKPGSVVGRLISNENRSFYYFIEKIKYNRNKIGGEKKIKYIYNNTKYIIYEDNDELSNNYSIHRGDNSNSENCIFIMINNEGIAYIHNINYYKDCVSTGLEYPGGGSILLKLSIQFIKDMKKNKNINIIQITDKSNINCEYTRSNIELWALLMLSTGETWYSKNGFLPYDSKKETIDKEKYYEYKKNQKIVKHTLVKNTKIYEIINKMIDKYKLHKFYNKETIEKFFKKYNDFCIMDFFYNFLSKKHFQHRCALFMLIYKKIILELKMTTMFGWSYYMKI